MAKYKVLSNLDHNGKHYKAGDAVELEEKHAKRLVELKVVEPAKKEDDNASESKGRAPKDKK